MLHLFACFWSLCMFCLYPLNATNSGKNLFKRIPLSATNSGKNIFKRITLSATNTIKKRGRFLVLFLLEISHYLSSSFSVLLNQQLNLIHKSELYLQSLEYLYPLFSYYPLLDYPLVQELSYYLSEYPLDYPL